MSRLRLDALHLEGQRVLSPEQVRATEQLRLLDERLRERHAQSRRRLAERLRRARAAARRNGHRLGRIQGMQDVADALAEDIRRWRDAAARIEPAVATVLQDATLALPRSQLLEMQLRRCLAAVRGGAGVRVHVNAAMQEQVVEMMRDWNDDALVPACDIVVTAYLPDGACVIETDHGMIEGQVERELAAFCERVGTLMRAGGVQP